MSSFLAKFYRLVKLIVSDGTIMFMLNFWCRFEQYVDYALDVPMLYIYKEKKYINCAGMSFRVSIYPF